MAVEMKGDRGEEVNAATEAHALAQRARHLEELGYSHLWTADVIGRVNLSTPDPLSVLAIAAASTTKVELGTCILQVPLRYPVELAHRLLTLHELADHRFMLGAGAGSTPGDFSAVGLDFDARFSLMRSSLETMRSLWRGETVGSANLSPSDHAMGGPKVLIGSWGGRWLDRAAKEYDGWIGTGRGRTWADVEKSALHFRELGGQRSVLASIHLNVDARRPATRFDCIQLECNPKEAGRRLERLEEIGFTDAILINVGNPHGIDDLAEIIF